MMIMMMMMFITIFAGDQSSKGSRRIWGRSACWKFAKSRMNKEVNREKRATDIRRLRPKVRSRVMLLNHGGARLVAEGGLCQVKGGLPKT